MSQSEINCRIDDVDWSIKFQRLILSQVCHDWRGPQFAEWMCSWASVHYVMLHNALNPAGLYVGNLSVTPAFLPCGLAYHLSLGLKGKCLIPTVQYLNVSVTTGQHLVCRPSDAAYIYRTHMPCI